MTAPRLRSAFQSLPHTAAIVDGTLRPRTCELDFVAVEPITLALRGMVRALEFDVCEMAMTTYLVAKAHGKRFTALPIFPMRGFHHGATLHNVKAGVRTPRDLEGRRVGVNRGYTVTTGVWARAILAREHGVDLDQVMWVLSGDEHVAEYRAPPNTEPVGAGRTLEALLVTGDLPAAIGVAVAHPDVQPLIAHPLEAGLAALQSRGHYPINHCIVVKDELLDAHPDLAVDLFELFAAAKQGYVTRLAAGTLPSTTPADALNKRVMDITGDPLPYGLAANRTVLDELVDAAVAQRILERAVPLESLFPIVTHALAG